MNNAILIQQAYPGRGYEQMIELTRARNEAYCKKWNFDYEVLIGDTCPDKPLGTGSWTKIDLIQKALDKGYEYIVWLDADAMIRDFETDLRDGCPKGIGACWMRIPQLDHWNVGVLFVRNTDEVKEFCRDWMAEYPGSGDGWYEQGVFNRMGMMRTVVETISDRWNATLNYSMVPDAVILGFHGNGNEEQRFEMMQATIKELEAV